MSRETSSQKDSEQPGQPSHAQCLELLINAPIGIFTSTPDGRLLSANAVLARRMGYETPEQLVSSITDLGSQIYADPEARAEFLNVLKAQGQVENHEFQAVTKDGTVVWASMNARAVKDEQSGTFLIQGFITDITEQKHVEENLRESRQLLERTFACLDEALFIVDADTRTIQDCNPAASRMFGYSREEMLGRTTEFLHVDDASLREFRTLLSAKLEKQEVMCLPEFRMKRRDGTVFPTEHSVMLLRDERGQSVGWVSAVRDITLRKKADLEREVLQAQLFQAQKMQSMGILAGGVAHDFNNLLQAMSGNIQLVLMTKHDRHPDADRLKIVARAIDRATRLVQQLLLFSRKADSHRQRVDLNCEVEQAAQVLERTIPKMVGIQLHLGSRLWPIHGDPMQIEQVLLNLGGNAAKAMLDGGSLTIGTQNIRLDENFVQAYPGAKVGDHVLLTVSDTGCGMDAETLTNIFDPFFTTREVGQGTGLGLASVYGIVMGHDGYVQCLSKPGVGTTFEIYWPAMKAASVPEATVPAKKITSLHGTECVLVVDDERDIRELTEEVLQACGYTVLTAASGEEALSEFSDQDQPIHLVILDLNMPGMGGHQCLRELLRLDPEVRVLVVSGYPATGQTRDTLQAGAVGFIGKPFRFTELLTTVREILDEQHQGDSPGQAGRSA